MKPQSTIAISMVTIDVVVRPKKRWRDTLGQGYPSVRLELFDTCCRVWDCADFTDCGDMYPYNSEMARMPYFAEVFKFVAEQYAANRTNPIGEFIRKAAEALDTSMAKASGSCVYFARAGDRIKIGWSRQVASRLAHLQTGNATPIELLGVLPGARSKERELHDRFADARVAGEWFEATPELLDFIRTAGT